MQTDTEKLSSAAVMHQSDLCICETRNGLIVTDKNDCVNVRQGVCVGETMEVSKEFMDALVPYTLPSGLKVVGTYAHFEADHGILLDRFDTQVTTSAAGSTDLFVCKLPSGLALIATYEQCITDGGTILGKLD
jgi:hypothetical protein